MEHSLGWGHLLGLGREGDERGGKLSKKQLSFFTKAQTSQFLCKAQAFLNSSSCGCQQQDWAFCFPCGVDTLSNIKKEDSTALWPPHRSPALSLVSHIPQPFGSLWAQAASHQLSMAGGKKQKQGSWSCGSRAKANTAE